MKSSNLEGTLFSGMHQIILPAFIFTNMKLTIRSFPKGWRLLNSSFGTLKPRIIPEMPAHSNVLPMSEKIAKLPVKLLTSACFVGNMIPGCVKRKANAANLPFKGDSFSLVQSEKQRDVTHFNAYIRA